MPAELIEPDFPSEIDFIWEWYQALHSSRQKGFGISPISYSEILAWSNLTDTPITPWEVSVIKQIDSVYIAVRSQKE